MNRRGHGGSGLLFLAVAVFLYIPILWPVAAVEGCGGAEWLGYVATGAWVITVLVAQGWAVKRWGWGSAIPLTIYITACVVLLIVGRLLP